MQDIPYKVFLPKVLPGYQSPDLPLQIPDSPNGSSLYNHNFRPAYAQHQAVPDAASGHL